MNKIVKWILILCGVFVVCVIAVILLVPVFFDVQKYRPQIENLVTEKTGRSFTMGEDMDLSIFPWVGVKLSDLSLANPEGFSEKDMVTIKNFEVRLKVMPLLSKKIEVKTFVIEQPDIFIERNKQGIANWEEIGEKEKTTGPRKAKTDKLQATGDKKLPIEALLVGNFSITNGRVTYIDQTTGVKKEITDLELVIRDISLDKPVELAFSAKFDKKPISLSGSIGPVGQDPGMGTLALDLGLKALGQLDITLKGHVVDPAALKNIDLSLAAAPFSPRKLMAEFGQPIPVSTVDPAVLEKMGLVVTIKGNLSSLSLSGGELILDDSRLKFSGTVRSFSTPDVVFDIDLDQIDLDRYLLPPAQNAAVEKPASDKSSGPGRKTDYAPLRKLVLDGRIKAAKLKAGGARVENINIHVVAQKGIITIDPLEIDLYQGHAASRVDIDVRKNQPNTKIALDTTGIQAGPLLKDVMKKEWIEGTLKADLALEMTGDSPEMIQQSLSGRGELQFTDGAVIGIDLANVVRNVTSRIGIGETPEEKPRTDFAELSIPFTADRGVVNTSGASLKSPLLRVLVTGNADLVKQDLDLRVEPKFVATLKGQGDTETRTGVMVPVLITGPFSAPKIRPDLKGLLTGETPDMEEIKQLIDDKDAQKEKIESLKKDVQKFLMGVPAPAN